MIDQTNGGRNAARRCKALEDRLIRSVVRGLLQAGWLISVDDGEGEAPLDMPLIDSDSEDAILAACFTVYIDTLRVRRGGGRFQGFVLLVHGNGLDVVADYSINLEAEMQAYNSLYDRLAIDSLN